MRKCATTMRAIVSSIVLACGGCTAAKATIQIVSAEQALRRADTYECEQIAAYEYVMAEQYLEKAREEAGYSEFRIADALARKSAEWSDRAIIFVERRGQEVNLEDFVEDSVEDSSEIAPSPDPAPAPEAPAPSEDDPDDHEFELDDE